MEPNAVFSTLHALITTAIIVLFYLIAGFAVRRRWQHRIVLNPLKIVASARGRASLSSLQVLYFSLIVLWLATYWVVLEGTLVPINNSILGLLGIVVFGAGVGKITDSTRFKVTVENWAWAKKKNWIKKDFTNASPERAPEFGDLITSERGFDVARFQAVGFSLVLGIALLYKGATAADATGFSDFTVDDAYLALIGISQGAYVGGKYVSGNLFRELNTKMDKVRMLEVCFTSAVASSDEWRNQPAEQRNMKLACEKCAPSEHISYMSAATEAAEIVESMTGNSIDTTLIQPNLPFSV